MKRLLLSSLLSCMLIGQASCNTDSIVAKSSGDIRIATVAGVASFLVPGLVAHYTNIPQLILDWAKKQPQTPGKIQSQILRLRDAEVTTWHLSVGAILAGSIITLGAVKNETISAAAVLSALGALISLTFSYGV